MFSTLKVSAFCAIAVTKPSYLFIFFCYLLKVIRIMLIMTLSFACNNILFIPESEEERVAQDLGLQSLNIYQSRAMAQSL